MYIFIMQNYKEYTYYFYTQIKGKHYPFYGFYTHSIIPFVRLPQNSNISLYWILYIQYYDRRGICGFEN